MDDHTQRPEWAEIALLHPEGKLWVAHIGYRRTRHQIEAYDVLSAPTLEQIRGFVALAYPGIEIRCKNGECNDTHKDSHDKGTGNHL